MPLPSYGVAIGTYLSFARDPQDNFGHWYHGHIRIQTPAGVYQSALDVDTPTGAGISFRVLHSLDAAAFAPIRQLTDGFHSLASTSASGALDYLRSPMLQLSPFWSLARFNPTLLLLSRLRIGRSGWVRSTGDNALTWIEQQLPGCTRVYVFGDHFQNGMGVHDVHMNQGDPAGSQWYALNGIWQDGGVVIERPNGKLLAWLVKFNSQSFNTDNQGHPI
jgi:hypothetical protein